MPTHRISTPLPSFDPARAEVVMLPEAPEAGYWTGCPGVLYEPERGRWLMTYRRRRPRGHPGGERGWRCAVAASDDGVDFTDVWAVESRQLGTDSMERFSLLPTPDGYQLYLSYVDPADSRWRIDVVDAAAPDAFDLAAARPALTAAGTGTEGVKDPYTLRHGPATYLFASYARAGIAAADAARAHATADIYNTGVTTHPTGLAVSLDGGATFAWQGEAMPTGSGWDSYQTRLNSAVPLGPGAGWLGFYDGIASHEQNYEEHCGLAVSYDLRSWHRLSTEGPWATVPYGTGSVRYVDAVVAGDTWHIYFEAARPDGAHELRLARVPVG